MQGWCLSAEWQCHDVPVLAVKNHIRWSRTPDPVIVTQHSTHPVSTRWNSSSYRSVKVYKLYPESHFHGMTFPGTALSRNVTPTPPRRTILRRRHRCRQSLDQLAVAVVVDAALVVGQQSTSTVISDARRQPLLRSLARSRTLHGGRELVQRSTAVALTE